MARKIALLILTFLLFNYNSFSQKISWKTGFNGFFDNREYFNDYAQPQSILGARTFGMLGFKIDDNNEFYGGADFLYEFGSNPDIKNLSPIAYFHHNNEGKELYMGAFPRRNLARLPGVILSDTIDYYRPNIEGIYIGFDFGIYKHDLWLDWTSRQTLVEHEAFMIGSVGQLGSERLFLNHYFMMYHFAGLAEGPSSIRDNGAAMINLGINLTSLISFDSLSISSGIVGSYDRFRTYYDTRFYVGSISELYAQYKGFALRSMLYLGDGQDIMLGDRMYQAPTYNRTDLIYKIFKKGRVTGDVEFSFHFIPGKIDYSQKFSIYIDISGSKNIK